MGGECDARGDEMREIRYEDLEMHAVLLGVGDISEQDSLRAEELAVGLEPLLIEALKRRLILDITYVTPPLDDEGSKIVYTHEELVKPVRDAYLKQREGESDV
jgi:hypothetical protein